MLSFFNYINLKIKTGSIILHFLLYCLFVIVSAITVAKTFKDIEQPFAVVSFFYITLPPFFMFDNTRNILISTILYLFLLIICDFLYQHKTAQKHVLPIKYIIGYHILISYIFATIHIVKLLLN